MEKVDTNYCLDGDYNGFAMDCPKGLDAVNSKLPVEGAVVQTPRFLSVMLSDGFPSREAAYAAGFTEPTDFESSYYDVLGKPWDATKWNSPQR